MISKNSLLEQEMIFATIYRLLDKYYLYGHFYDDTGDIHDKYKLQYYDENGFICDSNLRPLDYDPAEDEFSQDYCAILDVHRSTVFRNMFTFEEIEALSSDTILKKHLSYCIDKLIAMLRRGRNYASAAPIPRYYSDNYLKMVIAIVWKMFVARTIDCYDVKRKFANQPIDPDDPTSFNWDKRHYSGLISADEDMVNVPINIANLFSSEAQEIRREHEARRLLRQEEISKIITDSLSDEDRAYYEDFFRRLAEATGNW